MSNLVREARASGAELVLGVAVDVELVRGEAADAIIVATGALPYQSFLEGADEIAIIDASEVLTGQADAGSSVVIADGRCDWVGMGVAEKLIREGRHVRLCVMGDDAGQELDPFTRYRWLGLLHGLGVEIMTHVRLAGASSGSVFFLHVASLEPIVCDDADTVVLAQSYRPRTELEDSLTDDPCDVRVIGNCRVPRTAEEAVYEGLMAGLAV